MALNKEKFFFEPEQENEDLIKKALTSQLQKMNERQKGAERTDSKYTILKNLNFAL